LLSLKDNQGEFHDDIKLYFDTHLQDEFIEIKQSAFSHVNSDHGRIETRKVWLISNVACLVEKHPRWRSLGGIAMIESWREMNGKETYERRYYITSHHDKSADFYSKGD
jgi:hypothetical protein